MEPDLIQTANRVIFNTYKRFPLVLSRGKGCRVWDESGNPYIDFVAGIAVCNLGHAHPALVAAVTEQAAALWHVSNLYYTRPQVEVAAFLVAHSFADRVFFCNSGAEANEAAIKMARKYFKKINQPDRYRIIAMERSFHGRTMAALSATGQEKIREGFDPILEGFDHVPFNDLGALESKIGPFTAAVMLEPIQGEGGVRCPDPGYLAAVRSLCHETGTLLIFDEIQTGMGRTGKLFAYEHYGVAPDIMTLAKGLANGLPMGAMLATEAVALAFGPGSHATTFGGTPLVTAASLEVLRLLTDGGVTSAGARMGDYFLERLEGLKNRHAVVEDVRGLGLLLGMRLAAEGEPVVLRCMEKGFLINCVQGNILRFIPPLTIEREQIDGLIDCLDQVLTELHQSTV